MYSHVCGNGELHLPVKLEEAMTC